MKHFLSITALLAIGVMALGWTKPTMIAQHISKKLGVPVDIGVIKAGTKQITAENVKIGNPPDSVQDTAFSCQNIALTAPMTTYFQNDIVVDLITIDGIYLDLEFNQPKSKEGNWSEIMGRVNQDAGIKEEETPKEPSKGTVLIHKLVLTNISTDLVYRNEGKNVKHLPVINTIELTELSGEGGPDEIMRLVMGHMLKAVAEQQHIGHLLPGGHLRYLLPLGRLRNQ